MRATKRFVSFFAAFAFLISVFFTLPAPVLAQEWGDFSADVDGDGLTNVVEQGGWHNGSGGPYYTNPHDADTDDDGLTDGKEKLYDTDPSDDHSPGIYVEYEENLQTREYFVWQHVGNHYVALPDPLGEGAVVVRRGTTFHVGGPADATIEIEKSIGVLTTLTPEWDPCAGRWNIYVPSWGTVGIYTMRVQDGDWSESLNLYVIFDLPTDKSEDFVSAYIYTENPANRRSDGTTRSNVSMVYAEGGEWAGVPAEYTHSDYTWIPEGEWVNHGWTYDFENLQYDAWLFEDHIIPYINGYTSTWNAATAIRDHIDDVTCLDWPRVLFNSWQVLHPMSYPPYTGLNQCSNLGAMLAAASRSAGIPSRPVWTDWQHNTFDHATEVWTSGNWYVMRGGSGERGHCEHTAQYDAGNLYRESLRNTRGFYHGQGVYTIGEDWPWGGVGNFTTYGDKFRQNSWDSGVIVKKDWWETRFRAYWGTSSEPTVIGTPPGDWPDDIPPPPSAQFEGDPTGGAGGLTVDFTDQSSGHVRTWEWDFGDDGTSEEQNPSHTYDETGAYTVVLTIQGAGGTDAETKTSYIHVYEPVAAEFTGNPREISAGEAVTFTDLSTGDVTGWEWNFGDESPYSYEQNPSHTYVNTGTFDVSLTVEGAGGDSDTETKTDYITVNESETTATFSGRPMASVELLMNSSDYLEGLTTPPTVGGGAARHLAYSPYIVDEDIGGPDPPVQFGRIVSDYGVDLDGDDRFDQLVLEVEVEARQAGDYWIMGALAGEFAYALEDVHLEEGNNTVTLHFDGDSIYMSKTEGPYVLAGLWATDAENPGPAEFADNELGYARPNYETSSYGYSDFGVAGATLSDYYHYHTVDTDEDGYADALVVETSLDIEVAGTYTVKGILQDGQQEPLGQASWTGSGSQAVLQFDELRDTTGPYSLYLHVRNAAGQVTDGIVEPYNLGEIPEFGAKPISLGVEAVTLPSLFTPKFEIAEGYSDTRVDTDGDGQFDQLIFTVNVEVEAGEGGQAYRIEGWLMDENDSLISYAIGDSQVLAESVQSLSLTFDGRIINEHGVDGRYTLTALRALPGDTYSVLDEVDVAYTTPAYDHDDFEDPMAVPTVGHIFEDNMEAKVDYVATEGFEAGALDAAWTTSSSTGDGRIQITDSYGTAGGTGALLMDDVSDGGYTLNEAIWTLDLSDVDEASLVFWHAEWGDEQHSFGGDFVGNYNADGVAISDDGTNWHPVFNAPGQQDGVWQQYTIDLTAEAAVAGMTLGPDFRIKFQQYDNYSLEDDGRGWDEIVVIESLPSNSWTSEPPWSLDDELWYSFSHAWKAETSGSGSGSLTSVPLDLSHHVDPILRFRTCYEMQPASVGHLEASTNGVDWTQVSTYTNSTHSWTTTFLNLSSFDAGPDLQLRFTADSQDGLVWYIDDVAVYFDDDLDDDGIPNDVEIGGDPDNPVDTDDDGTPDYLDEDSDDDGIPDSEEGSGDTDDDGTPDYQDTDSDGDGIPDAVEAGDDPTDPVDTDNDGIPDYLDEDSDNDGIPDGEEGSGDTDGDGIPDYQDTDSDGDGIPDGVDPEPTIPNYSIYFPLIFK